MHDTMFVTLLLLTFECDDSCKGRKAQWVWVLDKVIGLQGVCKGDPDQITKSQHEAKTIMHQVHGGQDGLLRKREGRDQEVTFSERLHV